MREREWANPLSYKTLKSRAREMRYEPTSAELCLWEYLRRKKTGVRFRRQYIIDEWIVDFVCLSHRLIVEVDGAYHFTEEQQAKDELRTKSLERKGFTIIRFTNEEVINATDNVVQKIEEAIDNTPVYRTNG